MLKIDTNDKSEQRKFGLVVGAAFILLGLIRWAFHGFDMAALPSILWTLGAVLMILGAIAPLLLKPVFIAWIKLAEVLNFIMTHVLLTIIFYLIITPIRLVFVVSKEDSMRRKWLPDGKTYWEEAEEQPEEFDRYRQQF